MMQGFFVIAMTGKYLCHLITLISYDSFLDFFCVGLVPETIRTITIRSLLGHCFDTKDRCSHRMINRYSFNYNIIITIIIIIRFFLISYWDDESTDLRCV